MWGSNVNEVKPDSPPVQARPSWAEGVAGLCSPLLRESLFGEALSAPAVVFSNHRDVPTSC